MLSSLRSRPSHEQHSDPLSRVEHQTLPAQATRSSQSGDEKAFDHAITTASRVSCLDGLRGLACIAVFNYHFLWPWTPTVMLGHGAVVPRSPEPYINLLSLPIVCLLHRGRAMVAIFFAISGYVLCRPVVRSIHERDLEAVRRRLSSAVFRRIFRLYLPTTISMLLVACLAQLGAFLSEASVYAGPDSVYINGTIVAARFLRPCPNNSVPVIGIDGVRDYLGVQESAYLGTSVTATDRLCLNQVSQRLSPVATYDVVAQDKMRRALRPEIGPLRELDLGLFWIKYGGSWEEHPIIHEHLTWAVQNFTRTYAEWANPFNFAHYHPRYDPHTYTIPIELRGSMLIYVFLLGTMGLRTKWRVGFGGLFSAYSLFIGRWDMATFIGGAMISEVDHWASLADVHFQSGSPAVRPATKRCFGICNLSHLLRKASRWACFLLSLHLLSYPDIGAEYTPGFVSLSALVPIYYYPLSGWMFYQCMGALLLLPCIIRSGLVTRLLDSGVAQYLGRISFSLYLVHGPVLHSLGFRIMPRLFDYFGRTVGYVVGWFSLFSVSIYLAHWWHKRIDTWSTNAGKWVEASLAA